MYDAYIVFEGQNRELAKKLKNILESKYKLKIFIDEGLDVYTFEELKNKLQKSSYLIVLYSKSFNTHSYCIKEVNYFLKINEKRKVLVFSLDGSDFKLDNEILLVDKTKDIKRIVRKVITKIFNQNRIFSFKEFKNLTYIDNDTLFRKIKKGYVFLFIVWIVVFIGTILLFPISSPSDTPLKIEVNGSNLVEITEIKEFHIWELPFTKSISIFINNIIDFIPMYLALFFTLSGLYWMVFFKLNKEYEEILSWFYNFDNKSISLINMTLSFSVVMEFAMNAIQGKSLSFFVYFLLFIFFISYFFIGYLSSILIKYEIAHLNKKFFVKLGRINKNKITSYFISFPYFLYYFNNRLYEQCINKSEEWLSFKMFLFGFILFPKIWIYEYFIFPIKKLKFCNDNGKLYIKEELKPFLSKVEKVKE